MVVAFAGDDGEADGDAGVEGVLAALEGRLTNDEATEQAVVAGQLREIALLRLAGAVAP